MAATLTALAFLPQVLKTLKTRQTRDLSLVTLVTQCTGVTLWVVYAFILDSWPMKIGNAVTLVLMLTLLFFKLKTTGSTKP